MEARLQLRVQRYGWDRASEHYDRFWSEQLAPAQTRLLELAAIRTGERVLDVACGTGLVTLPAAAAVGPDGYVVGTDISDRMVEELRTRAREAGHDHVVLERMGAEEITLPGGSFDAVLCALGLMYTPRPLTALEEMRRVLRPGGRVVMAVWGERDRCGWADIFPIVDARVRTEVCPLFYRLGTGETLARSLEAAGFVHVEVERISTLLRYGSEEDALGAAFVGGPVALAYSRFDDRTREEAHREYLDSIAPYRNGRGYRIPGEFVLARGCKASTEAPNERERPS
jgi:ubiquinone/menaquinone biosynthesis C-methylase UbiE